MARKRRNLRFVRSTWRRLRLRPIRSERISTQPLQTFRNEDDLVDHCDRSHHYGSRLIYHFAEMSFTQLSTANAPLPRPHALDNRVFGTPGIAIPSSA